MEKCLSLFKLDYNLVEISNRSGELSSHYPSVILIPENEKQSSSIPVTINGCLNSFLNASSNSTQQQQQPQRTTQTIYENSYDAAKLKELIKNARFARSRTRFPIPVILYKGKYVCRSSTLSSGPEMYTRSSFNYLFNGTGATATAPDAMNDGGYSMNFHFISI